VPKRGDVVIVGPGAPNGGKMDKISSESDPYSLVGWFVLSVDSLQFEITFRE